MELWGPALGVRLEGVIRDCTICLAGVRPGCTVRRTGVSGGSCTCRVAAGDEAGDAKTAENVSDAGDSEDY